MCKIIYGDTPAENFGNPCWSTVWVGCDNKGWHSVPFRKVPKPFVDRSTGPETPPSYSITNPFWHYCVAWIQSLLRDAWQQCKSCSLRLGLIILLSSNSSRCFCSLALPKRRGISNPASHSGSPGFKSLPGYRLSFTFFSTDKLHDNNLY